MGVSKFHRLALIGLVGLLSVGLVTLSLGPADAAEQNDNLLQLEPTATNTPIPPTATNTPLPPTPTNTATPIPPNQSPTISPLADLTTNEDRPTNTVSFQVRDAETAAELLSVTVASSNTVLLPVKNIQLGGSGINRTVRLFPAPDKHGITTVTLSVSDGSASAQQSFRLLVRPVNDSPFIDLNGSALGTGFTSLYVSNAGAVPIVSTDIKVLDVDNTKLVSATIAIANPLDGIAEVLSVDTDETEITTRYNSGVLYLEGSDTNSHYRQVLRSIRYQNDAFQPNIEERTIQFVVSDGNADSNVAISTISIFDPHLSLEMFPDSQTIAQGGSAVFTVQVQNLGSVPLEEVTIQDPAVPDCERDLGTLGIGESRIYSCSLREIFVEFTNTASVHGRDSQGHEAYDDADSRVEVGNPNVQIVKSPSSQTRLKGEAAIFDVVVTNTSIVVDLVDVEVIDPLVPDCNRIGNHSFRNLAAGDEVRYQCQQNNVRASFTNVITVTGTDLLTQQSVQDSNIAKVELLDLAASLQAYPASLLTPGGPVSLTLTIDNLGSVDFTLTALSSDILGPLHDPNNAQLISNDCAQSTLPSLEAGTQFSCTFSSMINGSPPSAEVAVTVEAQDQENNPISKIATARISFVDRPIQMTYLPLTPYAYAQPDEDNDFPCEAYPIGIGQVYYFTPNDEDDWYYFDIIQPGMISINLRNFLPIDGQLAVWAGGGCDELDTLAGHNANFLPEKDVSFYAQPDRYFIWVSNSDGVGYDSPYSLYIKRP